jgi:hypothetical protein
MATAWTYGADGAAFSVDRGEHWVCGPHHYYCRSALEPGSETLARPDLVYSDPPWNQGNLNVFHTKAGLDKAGHSWLDLYLRILELARGCPCFLEGGTKQVPAVEAAITPAGPSYRCWPITYYRREPCVLHYVGPPLPPGFDPQGLDDDFTPAYAMERMPGGVVLDPCAGMGLTSRSAERVGRPSVSFELNSNRMSVALSRMARLIQTEPQRVS